ncbi:peptidylprolyl isomerase [Actinospica durhamensis]|uniref:Peptidyl-prolyl cis-trans isomerase n=1 Tax=Actinospica durhamensis TaxID=1508375 RepID=A0A941IQM8_9ACTN|nr:peptidylprolyl isomerase [Actinospica durhamensis]MBR7836414.1 peptidylprolyl isomerase [Actinospica durhamensis]
MAEETYAVLKTNHGDITVQLFPNHAPKTVRNFVELAEGTKEYTDPNTGKPGSGPYFDGTIFHRIISGFMIQGGDPLGKGFGGPGYTFDDEIHPDLTFNKKYLLAMANAGSRGGRGTNGSQFFITVSTPDWLNGKHTIFGEVADEQSRAVVDEIGGVRTGNNDRPVKDVVLESVTIERRSS